MNRQKIICNFTGVTRNEMMEGREYLVAPMIMIVEGVACGTEGALFYPADELAKVPVIWNYKPVVVNHPMANSKGATACSPEEINERKIGVIMNTVWEAGVDGELGKLKAEAWIEVARAEEVEPRLSDAIANNTILELSTGLFTDNELVSGEFNGKPFDEIARNYRPDHLAILPDAVGACSVKDGAGFLRLNQSVKVKGLKFGKIFLKDFTPMLNALGIPVENEVGFDTIRDDIRRQMNEKLPDEDYVYIEEVYQNFFIYEADGKLWKQTYVVKDDGVEVSADAAVEVVRVVEYRKSDGTFVGNNRKGIVMDKKDKAKKELVASLIENAMLSFTDEDEEELLGHESAFLERMLPVGPVVGNEEKTAVQIAAEEGVAGIVTAEETPIVKNKEVTVEEYIAGAPPAVQEVLLNGLNSADAARKGFIKTITANERNVFTEEQLNGMKLAELQRIAQLAGPVPTVNSGLDLANFEGQGDPVINENDDDDENDEEPLQAPTMNFGDGDDGDGDGAGKKTAVA